VAKHHKWNSTGQCVGPIFVEFAGVENAGVENAAPYSRGGKRGSGKHGAPALAELLET